MYRVAQKVENACVLHFFCATSYVTICISTYVCKHDEMKTLDQNDLKLGAIELGSSSSKP